VKKRFITAAAGMAIVLAAAVPAGSAFARTRPSSPLGRFVKCASLASQISSLHAQAAAAATAHDFASAAALNFAAAQLQAKFNANCV